MERSCLSCVAVFLVVCLYFTSNPVHCESTTGFYCPFGLEVGDTGFYKPCTRCLCESAGFSCTTCPASDPPEVPSNCQAVRKPGDYPACCEMEVQCP